MFTRGAGYKSLQKKAFTTITKIKFIWTIQNSALESSLTKWSQDPMYNHLNISPIKPQAYKRCIKTLNMQKNKQKNINLTSQSPNNKDKYKSPMSKAILSSLVKNIPLKISKAIIKRHFQ